MQDKNVFPSSYSIRFRKNPEITGKMYNLTRSNFQNWGFPRFCMKKEHRNPMLFLKQRIAEMNH